MKELRAIERLNIVDPEEIAEKRKGLKISDASGEPIGIGYDASGHLQYLTRKGFELLNTPLSSAHHADMYLPKINILDHLFGIQERTALFDMIQDKNMHVNDSTLLRLQKNVFIWVEVVRKSRLFEFIYKDLTDAQKGLTQEISVNALETLLLSDSIYSVGREDTMVNASESVEQDVLKMSGMLADITVDHVESDLELKFEDVFEEYDSLAMQ